MNRILLTALCSILILGCGGPLEDPGPWQSAGFQPESIIARGIDYSWARPGSGAISGAGFHFVCRYLSHDTSGKTITPAEAADLHAHGLGIVLVWEEGAQNALGGTAQGVADARAALAQANALGFPGDLPIYFAVDFDATPAEQTPIDAYLRGAASVIGAGRVGVYGGFYVVQRSFQHHTAAYGWQTLAWSGGQVLSGIHLYQNGQQAFGSGADVDEARQENYGAWFPGPPPPPPSGCGIMGGNGSLGVGQGLRSCDGRFTVITQSDGNLVLYQNGGRALWASNTTWARGTRGYTAVMQGDGNFVLYQNGGGPLWASNTAGHPGAYLAMQNDGNLVVYAPGGAPLWSSHTCCR